MGFSTQIVVPSLVRIKPGALERLGLYCKRPRFNKVSLFISPGIDSLIDIAKKSLKQYGISIVSEITISEATYELASDLFMHLQDTGSACLGIGGGKALDVARYVAFLSKKPFFSVPTALSNDSYCSPQSSLTVNGKRRSLPSQMPYAVVVDTDVCLQCPDSIWFSGIGDLVSKVSAIQDWKLAFHAVHTPVNDLAAVLSDATVFQFMASPTRDREGMHILATALMLNGVAMEICGSSRPASGSEHLISHALDATSQRPRLHGLQVGVATYLCTLLQGSGSDKVNTILDGTRFWDFISQDPFDKQEWITAIKLAPQIKDQFYTVLSSRDCLPEAIHHLNSDPFLRKCFV